MAIGGIGPGGGAGTALLTLRLALRQAQPGGGGDSVAAPAPAGTPDAVLQDVVARAQFSASLKVATAAVQQVDTMLQTYDAAVGAPA